MHIDYPKPENPTKDRTSTERVSIYCTDSDKDQWTTEAESGYSSRSEYLYELVEESRRYRRQGFLYREGEQARIEQLGAEVERLQAELENQSNTSHQLIQALEIPDLVKRALATKYRSLPELTETPVTYNSVLLDARAPVERALFKLAQRGNAHYKRGHGWKRTEEDR